MGGNHEKSDEGNLFRAAMADVQPLKPSGKVSGVERRLQPRANTGLDSSESWKTDGEYHFRAGITKRTLKDLRAARIRIVDEIDLHGDRRGEAIQRVNALIAKASGADLRCVLIITGKGLRHAPEQRGVIRAAVQEHLVLNPRVQAFGPARPERGGSGAICVLVGQPGG